MNRNYEIEDLDFIPFQSIMDPMMTYKMGYRMEIQR